MDLVHAKGDFYGGSLFFPLCRRLQRQPSVVMRLGNVAHCEQIASDAKHPVTCPDCIERLLTCTKCGKADPSTVDGVCAPCTPIAPTPVHLLKSDNISRTLCGCGGGIVGEARVTLASGHVTCHECMQMMAEIDRETKPKGRFDTPGRKWMKPLIDVTPNDMSMRTVSYRNDDLVLGGDTPSIERDADEDEDDGYALTVLTGKRIIRFRTGWTTLKQAPAYVHPRTFRGNVNVCMTMVDDPSGDDVA